MVIEIVFDVSLSILGLFHYDRTRLNRMSISPCSVIITLLRGVSDLELKSGITVLESSRVEIIV